jgi:hypothetical protein
MSETPAPAASGGGSWLRRGLPWLITLLCFSVLYWKIRGQAAREGETTRIPRRRVRRELTHGCCS